MSAKIVSLSAVRHLRATHAEDLAYLARIQGMDKLELLEEMVRFQEQRTRLGQLTPQMMIQGKALFSALESSAETQQLRLLTRTYRRHLEHELKAYVERDGGGAVASARD